MRAAGITMRLLACSLIFVATLSTLVDGATPRGSLVGVDDSIERSGRTESLSRNARGRVLPRVLQTSKNKNAMGMSGGNSLGSCASSVADSINSEITEVVTMNPSRCCNFDGPTAVFVTHAQTDPSTETGWEVFWNDMYLEIDEATEMQGTCFVFTGYNSKLMSERTLNELLIDVNTLVARLPTVPSMMSTDPTEQLDLANLFRLITNTMEAPSIGVFNAGLTNLNTEAIISGQGRIPYVGYTDDALYGSEAAAITKRLLDGVPASPLCFNARPELLYVGRRCAAYYQDVTPNPPDRIFGVTCRSDSSIDAILALLLQNSTNAVFTHVDCCQVVAEAVQRARDQTNSTIILGCQDENTAGQRVNFVTKQPIELQGYQTSSWANLPVSESIAGQDGKSVEFFPSLLSLLNTDIYSVVFF
jgi:hypothetical protein